MLTQSDLSQITGFHPNALAEAAARSFLARLPRMASNIQSNINLACNSSFCSLNKEQWGWQL